MCLINTLVYLPAAGGRLREPEVGVDRLVPFHSSAGHFLSLVAGSRRFTLGGKQSCRAADSGVWVEGQSSSF